MNATKGNQDPTSLADSKNAPKSLLTLKNLLLIAFFAINLYIFYVEIIFRIGSTLSDQCVSRASCRRFLSLQQFNFSLIHKSFQFEYTIDSADHQWREFRKSLPLLFGVVGFTFLIRIIFEKVLVRILSARICKILRTTIQFLTNTIFLLVLHGLDSIIVLGIAFIGYIIIVLTRKNRFSTYYIWTFAILVLCFKESYRIQHLEYFQFLRIFFRGHKYQGIYSWKFPMNFFVLRFISFAMDTSTSLHSDNNIAKSTESNDANNIASRKSHRDVDNDDTLRQRHKERSIHETEHSDLSIPKDNEISAQDRDDTNQKVPDSIFAYYMFIFFAPLYMAGPIMNFRDFHFQKSSTSIAGVLVYSLRWVFAMSLMEAMTAYFPCFAIISSGLLPRLSVPQIAVMLYITLKIMYLKFLLLWRLFRLWSLSSSVDCPENMTKCMSNNKSLEGFWRNWHASFNKWIVRYLYVPLGGSHMKFYSVWLVFVFVALWHDFEVKLFAWALFNSIFYIIEISSRSIAQKYLRPNVSSVVYFVITSMGSSSYILALIAVNLIGYSVGISGISTVIEKLTNHGGILALIVAYYFLSIGVFIMEFLIECGISKR